MVKATFITGIDTKTLPTKEEFVSYCNLVYLPDVNDERIEALWKRLNDTGWVTCRGNVTKNWTSFAKSTYEKMWKEDFGKEFDEWCKAKEEYEEKRYKWNMNASYYAQEQRNPKVYDIWLGADFKANNNNTWSHCALVSVVHKKDIYIIFKDAVSEEKEMDDIRMKTILIESIAKVLDELPVDAEVVVHSRDKDILGYMENTTLPPKAYLDSLVKLSDAKTKVKFVRFKLSDSFRLRCIAKTYNKMAYWERVQTREDDSLEVSPYVKFTPSNK